MYVKLHTYALKSLLINVMPNNMYTYITSKLYITISEDQCKYLNANNPACKLLEKLDWVGNGDQHHVA